jgi:hypothetical protein
MKRHLFFLLAFATFTIFASTLPASPTPTPHPKRTSPKTDKKERAQPTSNDLAQSANGWSYVKGEWVHPEGYKFVNGKVLRTTARLGKPVPMPPGKLALENPQKLTPKTNSAPESAKTEAEKAAETRRKNLTPLPASQTGSHL